jgi:hypothetical protein
MIGLPHRSQVIGCEFPFYIPTIPPLAEIVKQFQGLNRLGEALSAGKKACLRGRLPRKSKDGTNK